MNKIITGLGGGDVFVELFFEVNNFFWFDGVEVTSDTSVDDTDLLSDRHWLVLILLNERDECLYISGILIIYLQNVDFSFESRYNFICALFIIL